MSSPTPPEKELVERVRGGDASALQLLFDRYAEAARARIRRRLPAALHRKVDPEDILQDTYLVASQRFGSFEGRHEGSFGSWLVQIAEFKAREVVRYYMDAARRDARREVTRGARPDTHQFRGRRTTPSQAFAVGELEARADRAMAGLPEDYRRILALVRKDDLTLHQAAESMGRSYEATKKLYARALALLKERMGLDEDPS